jgi:hypothetical protein
MLDNLADALFPQDESISVLSRVPPVGNAVRPRRPPVSSGRVDASAILLFAAQHAIWRSRRRLAKSWIGAA